MKRNILPNYYAFILLNFFVLLSFKGLGQVCGTGELKPNENLEIYFKSLNNSARIVNTDIENEIQWIAIKPWVIVKDGIESISGNNLNTFITTMNQSFAPSKIQFYVLPSSLITDNTPESSLWNISAFSVNTNSLGLNPAQSTNQAINIYFVNRITDIDGSIIDGVAPFSINIINDNNGSFEINGKSIFNDTKHNCLYISASGFSSGKNILGHEMGHYFNLFHTFTNSNIKSERDDPNKGDYISDTPIDITKAFLVHKENNYFYQVTQLTDDCEYTKVKLKKNSNSPPNIDTWESAQFFSDKSKFYVYDSGLNSFTEEFSDSKFNNPPLFNVMGYFMDENLLSQKYCSSEYGSFTFQQIVRIKNLMKYRFPDYVDAYNILSGVPTPSNLQISYINGKSRINWSNNGNTQSKIIIERAIGNGVSSPADNAFVKIAELSADVTSYVDIESNYGTLAFYRVRISGSEQRSNIVPEILSTLHPTISAIKLVINSGETLLLTSSGCGTGTSIWSNGMTGETIYVTPNETTTYSAFCSLNGVYSYPSNNLTITVNYNHSLSNAEYFIDTDPGIGTATPLSISISGHINQTVAINLAPLNLLQGVHSIGIRVKDQNDKWSLTHTKTFLILGTTTGGTNAIADVEYFVDSLKQDKSNLVSTGISAANDATVSLAIPQTIPEGVHSVSFRVKDNNGKYSLFHTKTYLVLGVGSGGANAISEVQYFYDQDEGNRVTQALSLDANNAAQIPLNITLPLGVHSVSFRVKDTQGKWSLFHTKVFLVLGTGAGNVLSKIEYFFDTDPGFGSGTQVNYTAAVGDAQVLEIPTTGLNTGVHVLNVRVKNAANQWSLTHAKVFLILPDLGGNATVSRIEYFIGNTDPGQGAATSVAFSPNPDGRNVIASFDIDVSSYQEGPLRLNFRVKDSEGRWSSTVANTVIKPGSVEIVKIQADIYPNHYDVLQQSTVHRYYLLKSGFDQAPIVGAKIKYTVGGQPEIFESALSNSLGIVDLQIKTGGADLSTTTDDVIAVNQTAPLSLASVVKNESSLVIKSSQFTQNDFTIKPIWRLTNPTIEYGFTGGFQGGVGVGAKASFKLGTIKFEGSKASAAIGKKQGLDLTLTPWANDPNKFDVSVAYMPGFFLEGTLGPKVEADLSRLVTLEGGVYIEGDINRSLRQEFRYTLDLNNKADLFRTAYYILLLRSIEYPNALRAANFFKRISGFDFTSYEPPVVMSGIATEASLSANVGIGVNAAFFKKRGLESRVGVGVEFSGGGTLGLENYRVIENNTNITENITRASASYDISGTWGPALSFIKNPSKPEPPSVSSSLSFADFLSNGGHYSFGINRKFAGTVPTELNFEVSSSKELTLDGQTFTKEIVNNYKFDGFLINNIIQKAKSNTLYSTGNLLTNLIANNKLNPISIFNSSSDNNNFIANLTGFAQEATSSLVNTAYNSAIKNSSEKSLYNKFEGEIPFEIALGLDIQFEVNASAYTKYSYPKREDIYIPSLGTYLTTHELPETDFNLNLPYQNPVDIIMVAATQKVSEVASNVRESAAEFINKFQATVSTLFNKIFTNEEGTQMSLAAVKLHDFKNDKSINKTNSNNISTPSILSIDIPNAPNAFAANTDLKFSYYYPENLLKAKIGVDTFQIVTDVFYLNAYINSEQLSTSPNGSFSITTQFSSYDLERSGLPLNSTIKLVFLPLNSSQWEVIGDVNTSIAFNRLGVYAMAAKLLPDDVNPLINVQYPEVVATGNMLVSFVENGSGINWAKTTLFINGKNYLFTKVSNQLAFTVPFSSINVPTDGIYSIEIFTSDNAGNLSYYKHTYPCEGGISINSIPQLTPYKYTGNGIIEINAGNLIGTDVELKSTKAIILTPGFEAKNGKRFQAQIGGCL